MAIDFKRIGKNIEKMRNKINLTQEEMAHRLRVPINKIKNIEEGIEKIDIFELIGISQILKVSTDEILETNIYEDNLFKELKDIFSNCTNKQKNMLVNLGKMVLEYKI